MLAPTPPSAASTTVRHAPSRRTLIALATTSMGLGLAACDWPAVRVPGSGTEEQESTDGTGAADAGDAATLRRAVTESRTLSALVVATTSMHSPLSVRLAPLAQLHAAHLEVLGEVASTPAAPQSLTPSPGGTAEQSPPTVPAKQKAALRALLRAEQAFATALAGDAAGADSGAFARLLAVMAAGVDQQVSVLSQPGMSA